MDGPVFHRYEIFDLPLALDDQPQRHRLDASRREPAAHLFPQDRTDAVANQPVQDTARLLGIHQITINRARVCKRFLDGRLGDLMEDHAPGALGVDLRRLEQMPRDGFALTVGVGGQIDFLCLLGQLLDLLDHFLLLVGHAVLGCEVILHIHRQL